ncbi:MAG: Spy/CpxP family protein refolding chaperone [Rhizomicrobium sp.]
MRKALVPLVASLALCGAVTGALIATNARAAQTPKKPVMVAMVTSPNLGGETAAPSAEGGPPPGDMMGPGIGRMREHMRAGLAQMCKDAYAHKVGEMAFLETKLALTPVQAPLFARWKQVNLDIAQHRSGECDARLSKASEAKAGERPSMIDRMAREEEMLKTRLADLEAERPALSALYNALTPDQRKELGRGGMGDHPMMRHMMMGMMGRHRGMDPMGGPPGMPGMGPMDHRPADAPPPPPPQ